MIQFRDTLQQRLMDILIPAVGIGSDPQEFIKTFDNRLKDVDIPQLPFLVVNVRTAEKLASPEIGERGMQHYVWTVNIYYLDMEVNVGNYAIADNRRNHIMARAEKTLELNPFLLDSNNNSLRTIDADGRYESVYSSSIQAVVFDQTGQDDHDSFSCEMYLEVYTDRG